MLASHRDQLYSLEWQSAPRQITFNAGKRASVRLFIKYTVGIIKSQLQDVT